MLPRSVPGVGMPGTECGQLLASAKSSDLRIPKTHVDAPRQHIRLKVNLWSVISVI